MVGGCAANPRFSTDQVLAAAGAGADDVVGVADDAPPVALAAGLLSDGDGLLSEEDLLSVDDFSDLRESVA